MTKEEFFEKLLSLGFYKPDIKILRNRRWNEEINSDGRCVMFFDFSDSKYISVLHDAVFHNGLIDVCLWPRKVCSSSDYLGNKSFYNFDDIWNYIVGK